MLPFFHRNTDLACAEASRAKKEFIMAELHAQLNKNNEEATGLANELLRMLLVIEQPSILNQQLDAQLHQQPLTYGTLITAKPQMQEHIANSMTQPLQDTTRRMALCEAQSDDRQRALMMHQHVPTTNG